MAVRKETGVNRQMKAKYLVAAIAAVPMSNALADTEVTLSGQVNVAALAGDAVDDLTVVDNNTTGSRFRIRTKTAFGSGFTAGLRYELQAQFQQSNDPTELGLNSGGADGTVREVRYADVYIDSPFGKVGIGRGDGAANGTSESYGLLNFLGGAEAHLLFNGAGARFSDIDGLSRQNRIRYDSPNFSGFKFAISLDEQEENELALSYDNKFSAGALRTRFGVTTGEGSQQTLDFSAAYKFSFGLGLAYSTGSRDTVAGITDSENDWFQISYDFSQFTVSAGFGMEDEAVGATGEVVENELLILSLVWKPASGASVYFNVGDWENGIAAGDVAGENDSSNLFAIGGHFRF